jgi:hypothetical protein
MGVLLVFSRVSAVMSLKSGCCCPVVHGRQADSTRVND